MTSRLRLDDVWRGVRALGYVSVILLWALLPRSQVRAEPASGLALYVDPSALPAEPLRAALEAELGFPFALVASAPEQGELLSVLRSGPQQLTISLHDATGRRVERDAPLLEHGPEAIEAVGLLAANLLRNEAQDLIAQRSARAAVTPPPAPVAPAPPPPPALTFDPTQVAPCASPVTTPVGLDFAPGLGFSTVWSQRDRVRGLSLGWLGSLSGGVHGFGLAGTIQIVRGSFCGVVITGGANWVSGSGRGLQLASFNLTKGSVQGVSAGVLNVVRRGHRGLQLGVGNLTTSHVHGAALGLLNVAIGELHGVAAGVANLATSHVTGVQAAAGNIAGGEVHGLQAGMGNIARGDVHGAQIGIGNLAGGDVHGVQLGVGNLTRGDVHGVQLGVFNYANRSRAPIGLVSIVRNGRTTVDIWGPTESGIILAGATHGGQRVHNVYSVGVRTGSAGERFAFSLGVGARLVETKWFRLDLDAVAQYLYRNGASDPTFVPGVRMPFTFIVTRGLGLMIAPSYQFMITQDEHERSQAPFFKSVWERRDLLVEGWPGGAIGLRFELPGGSQRAE